jgi:hypothetical protein
MKKYIKNIVLFLSVVTLLSCEQERLDPILTTAEGGGTLNTYTAYTIEATDPAGSNVYGRIVFYKTSLDQTLVQVSLYNTVAGLMHPALIIDGPIGDETSTMLALDNVSGDSGEFATSKFFIISDTTFYDAIPAMDSHINIYLSTTEDTVVASGNLGVNADPVESN